MKWFKLFQKRYDLTTVEGLRAWVGDSYWRLLAPHIEGPFYKPKKQPDLQKLYQDALLLEKQAAQLSRDLGATKKPSRRWFLLAKPLERQIRDAVFSTRGARQQFEQLLFGGDPYYTGERDPDKQLEKSREIFESERSS